MLTSNMAWELNEIIFDKFHNTKVDDLCSFSFSMSEKLK